MMNRFVAMALIPFFVVGSSLAHSHASAARQSPTEGRAHIHTGSALWHAHRHESHGHSHHIHRHGHRHSHGPALARNHKGDTPKPIQLIKTVDHESDAVYFAAEDFVGTPSARTSIEICSNAVVAIVEDDLTGNQLQSRHDRPPHSPILELPFYLLHAALRL
jgi:hypothetical protein